LRLQLGDPSRAGYFTDKHFAKKGQAVRGRTRLYPEPIRASHAELKITDINGG
jgi:hypothetical protein